MRLEDISSNLKTVCINSGLDKQSVRGWLKKQHKSKIACDLVRGGVITLEQYKNLEDGRGKYFNNLLLAFVYITNGITSETMAELIGVTTKTMGQIALGTSSETSKKALFYVCEKKFGLSDVEELYNGSFNS